ncbi:response regulator transcription factor [Pseudothauera nasutitermitis]|uniref:Response regulator transcription factor n=1 Tax=Pseudothauera nasutitermitis TaxID=2565930 RepID=A0A4S4AT38_9RHOO|nr:response regulator transcription factor [Pseudothauera nasutitermitis]THF63012.1 response regulator transcription factor [Pseudothauera nasutitermitis]
MFPAPGAASLSAAAPSIDGSGALRVLLASPTDVRCERLEAFLANTPDIELAGWTDSESRAMQLFFLLTPDVTVLDWRVSVSQPARFVGLLKRVAPYARIVSVVPAQDSMPARAARALGADAVVTSDDLQACLEALVIDRESVPARFR